MGRIKSTFPHIENGDVKERLWMIELYPDTTSYNCDTTIDKLIKYCDETNSEFAYILHDKDVDSDGVLKKSHYHFCIKFENPRYQSALAKRFLIPYNYFKCWDDWPKCVQYLIHLNDRSKYQYDINDIHSNIGNINDVLLPKTISEEIAITMIMEYINNFDSSVRCIDIQDVMQFALKNHIYTHLRRSGSLFSCMFNRSRYIIRE